MDIDLFDILTVFAIFTGPFFGIWAHGKLEERKKAEQRKLAVFKTLMATRAAAISEEHVAALNRIDIEFNGSEDKEIRASWAVYLDHLNNAPQPPNVPSADSGEETQTQYKADLDDYKVQLDRWSSQIADKLASLLSLMGKRFDYDFDEVKIKRAAYRPKRNEEIENIQFDLLTYAAGVARGDLPLPVWIGNLPEQTLPIAGNALVAGV